VKRTQRLSKNLTIRSKLAAALAVPLTALAVFAGSQVVSAYERGDRIDQQAGLATSATGPSGLLSALAAERDFQTLRAIGSQNLLTGGPKNQREAIRRTDGALGAFRNQLADLGGEAGANYRSTLNQAGSELEKLRDDADKAEAKTATAAGAKQAEQLFDRYTQLVERLLDADQRSGATIADADLRSGAELLNALARQRDIEARLAITAGIARIAADPVAAAEAQGLAARLMAGGEVREVAEALNQVQNSALGLAVEQATLRRNVADAYVNLGRRNQNLLSRQLEFITNLENDESDPETLEHLFKLDHLATRMRRNAESLLVLAGHAPPRTWGAPVPIGDVVRGALGEVEGYQRVRLRHLDDAEVDGAAAADVSHVIAELSENALAFSPPDADVEIYGRLDDHGYVLTIVDSGIGMPADELDRANELISSPDALTFAPSRFLGHYVVAQLARRHGLGVHLAASPAGGLTAMVGLPPVLLGMVVEDAPVDGVEAPDTDPDVASLPTRPVAALPRRGEPAPEQDAEAESEADTPVGEATILTFSAVTAMASDPAPTVEPPAAALEVVPELEPTAPEAIAPGPESVVAEEFGPDAVPQLTPEPPVEKARPRLGIGSFADLRATPAPRTAPSVPESDPTPDADVPAAALPTVPVAPHPEVDPTPAPDHRVAFSEVSQAVEVAAGRAEAPAPAFSEDFLPSRLPKRGRKAAKAAWSREKPAQPAVPAAPVDAAAPAVPEQHAQGEPTEPATQPDATQQLQNESASTDGNERLAFFAAFRSAAERAREEAGIDDRRVGH
jgi:signal transduction histidine kinase